MSFLRQHWQLFLITVAVFVFWNTPVIYPLKILVVFMHELAHGLAAIMTGGSIEAISLSNMEGGYAITRGGNGFLILSAGYFGSLLIGTLLLVGAVKTNADRFVLGFFGLAILVITVLYIRQPFAIIFCTSASLLMIATAWFLNHHVSDFVLRLIGLTSMIYIPYDIISDTISRSHLPSDAFLIAEQYGGTTVLWGGFWLVLSFALIGLCLRLTFAPRRSI
ncbi:M50 family metallopeptidase [Flavimaricola marinus]|uniref:Peptidase M50B-like protein n=1 Tax=Flavimaricola marinus TaxID=1819565 RepID=A0A238LE98_9RHOB|nr:M50 family metallopeptidase [Flavimaricola marinus]SMY07286.1 hypothetical protein LOM8899_01419 [Flavimaricola marinus]